MDKASESVTTKSAYEQRCDAPLMSESVTDPRPNFFALIYRRRFSGEKNKSL